MWPKNGCEFWDDCFACPAPDCILGNRRVTLARHNRLERLQIEGMLIQGVSIEEIAGVVGKKPRTIYRHKRFLNVSH